MLAWHGSRATRWGSPHNTHTHHLPVHLVAPPRVNAQLDGQLHTLIKVGSRQRLHLPGRLLQPPRRSGCGRGAAGSTCLPQAHQRRASTHGSRSQQQQQQQQPSPHLQPHRRPLRLGRRHYPAGHGQPVERLDARVGSPSGCRCRRICCSCLAAGLHGSGTGGCSIGAVATRLSSRILQQGGQHTTLSDCAPCRRCRQPPAAAGDACCSRSPLRRVVAAAALQRATCPAAGCCV